MTEKLDRLYWLADAIEEHRLNGRCEPIYWHLALRGYGPALLRLANRRTQRGKRSELGRANEKFSPLGMMLSAFNNGDIFAAQHLAMSYFNIGDMAGYRHWLRRAAKAGDQEAINAFRRFESRYPHRLAFRIGRGRPTRSDGS